MICLQYMKENRLKQTDHKSHSRKKGQRVAPELLSDISQRYVDPDRQEGDSTLVKTKGSQTVQIVKTFR